MSLPGFRLSYGAHADWKLDVQSSQKTRTFQHSQVYLHQLTNQKFLADKLWLEDDAQLIAVEGILYNKEQIIAEKWFDTPTQWRGTFAYLHYDKRQECCRIYNDQIGSRMLFWCQKDGATFLSSDIFDLIRITGLRTPNSQFINDLLSYGYTLTDQTMVEGIHRLLAGEMLEITPKGTRVHPYFRFENTPLYTHEDQIIQEIEQRFSQAVQRVLDKNQEYGLQHVFPLSGGLDSRMAQLVARELTTAPILNFTYSQSGHYDHTLPKEIASYLGNLWEFLPLDEGKYLTDIESVVRKSQMLVNYNGPSEINYCIQQRDWTNIGVVLTGVNGDSIFSMMADGRHEMEDLYGQSFAGNSLGSPLFFQYVTDSYSPFMDVDVLEYILHVPHRLRWNYHIYDRWILRYHPEACQWHHKYEQIGHRHWAIPLLGKKIVVRDLPILALYWVQKKLHIRTGLRAEMGDSMNPYDGWAATYPALRKGLDQYYNEHSALLNRVPDVQKECVRLYQTGTVYEQCKVLTILSSLHLMSAEADSHND